MPRLAKSSNYSRLPQRTVVDPCTANKSGSRAQRSAVARRSSSCSSIQFSLALDSRCLRAGIQFYPEIFSESSAPMPLENGSRDRMNTASATAAKHCAKIMRRTILNFIDAGRIGSRFESMRTFVRDYTFRQDYAVSNFSWNFPILARQA